MNPAGRDIGALAALFTFGVVWHAIFAALIEGPTQWDSAYTWEVARNLARGEGAVTDAMWTMAWQPEGIRHVADLHWSPLPSRILVPAMWVSKHWRATQVVSVIVAALWGPLGWSWGRRLGLHGGLRWLAGAVAVTGLGALPFLGVPDSVGLFGLVAGGALLAAATGRTGWCVMLCILAALTRGDGFLVGLACAVSLPGWKGLWPALGGLGTTALWSVRNLAVAGEGFLELRGRVSSARAVGDLLLLHDPPGLSVLDRLTNGFWAIPSSIVLGVLMAGLLPAVVAGLAWVLRRRDRSLWALVAFGLLVVVVDNLLAPGIASKGTTYRSLCALIPAISALAVVGATDVLRGLPRWLLPAVVAVGGVAISVGVGRSMSGAFVVYDDCGALDDAGVPADAPILAYEPLHVTARCGRPAVQIPPDATPAELAEIADRYRIDWAVVAPAEHRQPAWRVGQVRVQGWTGQQGRVLTRW